MRIVTRVVNPVHEFVRQKRARLDGPPICLLQTVPERSEAKHFLVTEMDVVRKLSVVRLEVPLIEAVRHPNAALPGPSYEAALVIVSLRALIVANFGGSPFAKHGISRHRRVSPTRDAHDGHLLARSDIEARRPRRPGTRKYCSAISACLRMYRPHIAERWLVLTSPPLDLRTTPGRRRRPDHAMEPASQVRLITQPAAQCDAAQRL